MMDRAGLAKLMPAMIGHEGVWEGKESQSGLILLELWRKDLPGAWFWEIICLAPNGQSRARTWHWFDAQGQLFRRTLCDERKVSSAP